MASPSSRSISAIAPIELLTAAARQCGQHRADVVLRTAFEFGESLAPLGRQAEPVLPSIRFQRLAGDQSVFVKVLDDPAEVAGVEAEFDADLLGGRVFPMGEFVKHPRLAQRVRAFHQVLVEHPEFAGIEAVEGANRRDLAVGIVLGHGAPRYLPLSNNYLTLASILAPGILG